MAQKGFKRALTCGSFFVALFGICVPAMPQSLDNPLISLRMARGDICDRTHYVIVKGADNFDGIVGDHIERDRYKASLPIDDDAQCYITQPTSIGRRTYHCRMFENNLSEIGLIRNSMRSLENQLTRGLTRENRFRFVHFGELSPRYYISRQSDDNIRFSDWYAGQTVEIRLITLSGDNAAVDLSIQGDN
jgi:hypothetical protein